MGDLQCPANILLVAIESGAAILESTQLAGVFVASQVADASAISGARLDVADGAGLARAIEELADLYRGETIALVTTSDLIAEMLGLTSPGTGPIAIAVDDSGWSVSHVPG